MKDAEILVAAPGEIRIGEGIGAATFARANLRRAIVSPVGIASEHRSPNPAKPTRLRLLLDRPSDR